MLIDLQLFLSHSLLILGMTLALMLVKGCVVAALVKLRGSDSETAWRSGLALAQGGEFCFALMAQMQQNRLIPDEFNGLLLAATFARCCSPRCCCAPRRHCPALAPQAQSASATGRNQRTQRRVAGPCGDLWLRAGRTIHRTLHAPRASAFIALDDDPVRVQEAPPTKAACITATAVAATCSPPSAWSARWW
jgi:CPA2 family monovalent cation:H+ antiporter-2